MAKKILVAAAMLAAASFAQAQSANITVTGNINPGTCTMSLGGGGKADFGGLSSVTVKTWARLGTPARYVSPNSIDLPLSINCTSATKMAIKFTDNRSASAAPSAATDPSSYGLGTYTPPSGTATNIGMFIIDHTDLKIKATATATAAAPVAHLLTLGNAITASAWSQGAPSEPVIRSPISSRLIPMVSAPPSQPEHPIPW